MSSCGDSCLYFNVTFDFTLEDIIQYEELFLKLPKWAAKAAITSITDRPDCTGAGKVFNNMN